MNDRPGRDKCVMSRPAKSIIKYLSFFMGLTISLSTMSKLVDKNHFVPEGNRACSSIARLRADSAMQTGIQTNPKIGSRATPIFLFCQIWEKTLFLPLICLENSLTSSTYIKFLEFPKTCCELSTRNKRCEKNIFCSTS